MNQIDKNKKIPPVPAEISDEKNSATKNVPADTWAADSLEELEDWIEEQGIQLRY